MQITSSFLCFRSGAFSSGCANGYGGYGTPKQVIIDTHSVDMGYYWTPTVKTTPDRSTAAETTEGAVEGAVVGGCGFCSWQP